MDKGDLILRIVALTATEGLREATRLVFKEYLSEKLLKIGRLFAFGPVSFLTGLAIDWVLKELLDLLEDWAKYQITKVLVGKDFDRLKETINERDEIELKEGVTDAELDEIDQKMRDAARDAFRIGRL